jgi:mitochondrial chaperone BCS1
MKLNLCHLSLSGRGVRDDDDLNRKLNQTPDQSIILLEDIDSIFVGRESVQKSRGGGGVTFSGLLNALDGIRSQEGRIIFMTTNHREKLDPALLRPGRADYHVHLDYASYSQQYRMFLKFNPGATAQATEFARAIPDKKLSMA